MYFDSSKGVNVYVLPIVTVINHWLLSRLLSLFLKDLLTPGKRNNYNDFGLFDPILLH